jgi:hypothetical protein
MSKLHLTTVFHGNLGYSSIPEAKHKEVIVKCYWPVISLVDKLNIKLGFEFSAQTLELIKRLDENLLQKIKQLWEEKKIEVVGSGYIQSIFPLIPAKANLKNLEIGNKVYEKLLGKIPEIAYVNEHVYAKGIVRLYKESGYKGIIIDWVNALKSNEKLQECKFSAVNIKGAGNETIKVIWNNSILFQKLQRYVYGDLNLEEYIEYIMSHYSEDEERCLMIYGSDMEVFDFRPRNPKTLHSGEITEPEIEKMEIALEKLKSLKEIEFVLPEEVMYINFTDKIYDVGSPDYPIITKKQDKYNVTRWAVCGRENSKINTQCYKLFNNLQDIEFLNRSVQKKAHKSSVNNLWMELTNLLGSDFRTHITDEKYTKFINKLSASLELSEKITSNLISQIPIKDDFILINPNDFDWNDVFEFTLQFEHGRFRKDVAVLVDGQEVKTQQEETEYYRDGSIRTSKIVIVPFIKSHSVAQGKICIKSDLGRNPVTIDSKQDLIKTPEVKLVLSALRGGTIKELVFPEISDKYLMGELSHGFFDDISFSSDWYSGHVIIYDRSGKKFTDLTHTKIEYPDINKCSIRVPVKCKIDMPIGVLWKTYYVYVDRPMVDLIYHFNLDSLFPLSFRLGIATVNPQSFNIDQLKYSTVNGGNMPEIFYLKGKTVRQDEPVSFGISTRHCLGATEGWLDISDNEKGLAIITDKSQLYSVPLIHFEEVKKSFFLRAYTSISEMDDTTECFFKGHNRISVTFLGHKNNFKSARKQRLIINIKNKKESISLKT